MHRAAAMETPAPERSCSGRSLADLTQPSTTFQVRQYQDRSEEFLLAAQNEIEAERSIAATSLDIHGGVDAADAVAGPRLASKQPATAMTRSSPYSAGPERMGQTGQVRQPEVDGSTPSLTTRTGSLGR